MTPRDKRTRPWFWIHNRIIDEYGSRLTPYGLSVYMALARYANNESQECKPTIGTLAALTGMSESKVRDGLKTLTDLNLVAIKGRSGAGGQQIANEYALLDIPDAPKPSEEPPTPDPTPAPDTRAQHPALQNFRAVTNRYPHKAIWDLVIERLDGATVERIRECHQAWIARGYNPNSVTWTEWVKTTIPPQGGHKPTIQQTLPTHNTEGSFRL